MKKILLFIIATFFYTQSYSQRNDIAILVDVPTNTYTGSLQNGSWSPDNKLLMCTNWESAYNQSPANILIIDLNDYSFKSLTTDGQSNVNMPGSTWNPVTDKVIFSSEANGDGDQAHTMDPNALPGTAVRVTPWTDRMCWEPGFSDNGDWTVYEAHYLNNVNKGLIETYKIDGTEGPYLLTSSNDDCRQPSWSPMGDKILYQKYEGGSWDIWTMNTDGTNKQNVTGSDSGDKTDASFSPDGKWIVYSTDNGVLDLANIFVKNLSTGQLIRVTNYSGYDGAPSWSNNNKIVFESTTGDPDISSGATLWIIDAPVNGNTSTGITDNITKQSINIYPNPCSSLMEVNISLSGFDAAQNVKFSVVDILGKVVYDKTYNNTSQIFIPTNTLSSGIYFINISTDTNTVSKKLFIE